MTLIIVTGTPGTGKTTIAKALAKELEYQYISDKEIIKKYKLAEEHDNERNAEIIDEERFAESLLQECQENCIADSHLTHFIDPARVTLCIVTECELPTLKQRLEQRDYDDQKIRENLDVEIFETCRIEAEELGHNVLTISTERPLLLNIEKIKEKLVSDQQRIA